MKNHNLGQARWEERGGFLVPSSMDPVMPGARSNGRCESQAELSGSSRISHVETMGKRNQREGAWSFLATHLSRLQKASNAQTGADAVDGITISSSKNKQQSGVGFHE